MRTRLYVMPLSWMGSKIDQFSRSGIKIEKRQKLEAVPVLCVYVDSVSWEAEGQHLLMLN